MLFASTAYGRQKSLPVDSVSVRVLPEYDRVGKTHRKVFGENYRKEYGMETKLPVIYLSKIAGGLKATELGGGFQTRSVRLEDSAGREWTLRGVEKYPEILLPPGLRETVVRDIIKDNMSSQNPFSALIVPVLAQAIAAPHSSPIIGWVAPDPGLGSIGAAFAGTVCLLEEREPVGKTDNSVKMLKKLKSDHNNTFNALLYLQLKCLDVLIGDWDRHEDQWRWRALKSPGGISYMPVPRDRDQVFYRSDGLIQHLAQSSWFLPMMQGYERPVQNINWFFWEGREINSKWFSGIDRKQWDSTVNDFTTKMTDGLFEKALSRLPQPGYALRHDQLLSELRARRAALPKMMADYYEFFNRIVDVELSDKPESVHISDTSDGGLVLTAEKEQTQGKAQEEFYRRSFDPKVTGEIRIYLHGGSDSVYVSDTGSKIRLRIIGGEGAKHYHVENAEKMIRLYGKTGNESYSGMHQKLIKRNSQDTAFTAYVAKDMYSRRLIFPNLGFNKDDGLAAGIALRLTRPGFRKLPYASSHSFSFLYSFATSAYKFYYTGAWLSAMGKADLVLQASAFAPSNTQNFFGFGNQTRFDESANGLKYYRARFNLYDFNPSLRWRTGRSTISAGPAFQYYSYDEKENQNRLSALPAQLHSSDSNTVARDKSFAGAVLKYSLDTRDQVLIPVKGLLLESNLSAYKGLNHYSNNFGQLIVSLAIYQRLDSAAGFVLANRSGGGLTIGKPAFYQAQFLGGQGNLLGYRQFRFAGEQSVYNNLELRIKAGNFVSYVLPGQVGFLGMYDVGRVWKRSEHSQLWHHGVGAGVYFAPASLSLLRLVMAYSREGWYPYFALNFRY